MRALKLHPTDQELFHDTLDCEKHAFLRSHLSAFKRMWTEEGKVYWLRFLLTFRMSYEAEMMVRTIRMSFTLETEGRRVMEYVYVHIHKHFIENSCNSAARFLENVFVVARSIQHLHEPRRTKNPIFTKDTREAFRAILGEPDFTDEIPLAEIVFACSVYGEFTCAIVNLLKRWLRESDLSTDALQKVDYSLVYWKPDPAWEDKFVPSCFERYLADYWKSDLPKMLLTCDVHNIFSAHGSKNCCSGFKNDVNFFDLLKGIVEPEEPFVMKHVAIIPPDVSNCLTHSDCRVLIVHSPCCKYPYVCDSTDGPCEMSCERLFKKKNQSSDSKSVQPKVSFTEVSVCKKKNNRTVSTLVESEKREIVTHFHLIHKVLHDSLSAKEYLQFRENLLMQDDYEVRNSFYQQKKKYELKMRLRTKLDKKMSAQFEQIDHHRYHFHVFEKARQTWLSDLCQGQVQNLGHLQLVTSVAVGTSDVIFGRVVCPTGSQIDAVTATTDSCGWCESLTQSVGNKTDTQAKSKKFKSKKKKKGKGSDSGDGHNGDMAETDTSNNKLAANNITGKELSVETALKLKSVALNSEQNCDGNFEGKKGAESISVLPTVIASEQTNSKGSNCIDKTLTDSEVSVITKDTLPVNKNVQLEKCIDAQSLNANLKMQEEESKTSKWGSNVKFSSEKFRMEEGVKVGKTLATKNKNVSETESKSLKGNVSNQLKQAKDTCNISKVRIDTTENICTTSPMKYKDNSFQVSKSQKIETNSLQARSLSAQVSLQNVSAEYSAPKISNSGELDAQTEATPIKKGLSLKEEETVDKFLELIGVIKKPTAEEKSELNLPSTEKAASEVCDKTDKSKLRVCAFCSRKEVECKTFKRCAKCKLEKFPEHHYYCSRACQIDDWQESHRDEHLKHKNPVSS